MPDRPAAEEESATGEHGTAPVVPSPSAAVPVLLEEPVRPADPPRHTSTEEAP